MNCELSTGEYRCVNVCPFNSNVPAAKPMRVVPLTEASSVSVTFVKMWSRLALELLRGCAVLIKYSAPRPSGPLPAMTRLFGKRSVLWLGELFGTRTRSCAPLETVIVLAFFPPKVSIRPHCPLCASRIPSRTSTVPEKAVLLSLEITAVPAPSLTIFVIDAVSCV